jgi:hypothetical protein
MKTQKHIGLDCVVLENEYVQILVPRSLGPRILSLSFRGSPNLLAELPDFVTERPDGKQYHFYGGHRLWLAPEDPILSYGLDDQAVEISKVGNSLLICKPVEEESGIEKSLLLNLDPQLARLTLEHRLTNRNQKAVEFAAWTITQFRTGGLAMLPQSDAQTGFLPNRAISFWPYSDVSSPQLHLGNRIILLNADFQSPFKIGFPNPRGWMAYWLDGILFVKKATFERQAKYTDFGCSSECYCNNHFLELETLAPLTNIAPGTSVSHAETWELYPEIPQPKDESEVEKIVQQKGLE